jgi:4'-phosphopantetheinyl transferase
MAVDLWAARLERALTEQETERILQILPPNRRERLMKLRQEEKRREPLCAYLILCLALWELYQWRGFPEMAENSMGKPYFPEHPGVHFNISHTTGAVLVGVSDQPVGVDIERIRPVSQRTMRRLADVSTEQDFFRNWVRREARTKRSGNGIGTMMRSETPLQQGEFYYELDTFPGYVAGVATRDKAPLGPLRKYSLDDLL